MILKITAIFFIALSVGCSTSSEIKQSNVEARITKYGIYKNVGEYTTEANEAAPSGRNATGKYVFVEQTDIIPLEFNIGFGYDFEITGLPKNKDIEITLVYEHPPIYRHDKKMSTSFRMVEKYNTVSGVVRDGLHYILNHDYELVPGTWTQSYEYKGRIILKKEFYVQPTNSYNNAVK